MLASWPMLLLVRLEVSAPIPLGQRCAHTAAAAYVKVHLYRS